MIFVLIFPNFLWAKVDLVQVVEKLQNPWAMDFLPGSEALVTEKPGRLQKVNLETGKKTEIQNLPEVHAVGQGGLLDVMVHPDFKQNQKIFLTFSAPTNASGDATTTLISARLEGQQLLDQKILFQADPALPGGHHFGSRVRMAQDGMLYFSVGERGRMKEAQDPQNHLGTVIRLQENGKVPQDNPFLNNRKGRAEIFSYGHRNPQGMALHPKTGKIWVHEHGPQGGDEINILKAGANYGWPKTTFGEQYGGGKIGIGPKSPGIEEPLLHWTPSIAPSGMDFYQGDIFPNWNGDLLVGSLKFRMLVRVDLEGSLVQGQEVVFQDRIGRVRDVRVSPEGKVYLLNDEYRGGIFRLDPL
ncbi:MAG: PQQ-dependent sugar dehydrogenase [SAR324 cluster bacterium]|nr:PQQ-dependent sugar dehydrogenase [SAR324 cluster bacterium]